MDPIVTLTTDFGTCDGFVAQMKGKILGINPHARLVDVTHDIEPFAILEGALVLKGVSRSFPPGTIHVAVVDPGVGTSRRGIVLKVRDQLFVGPDNGLFTLIAPPEEPHEVREIRNPDYFCHDPHPTFHGRDVFAPVAAHLSTGKSLDAVGPHVVDPVVLTVPEARSTEQGLEGEVFYVDRFGNLFSTIEAGMITRPVAAVLIGETTIGGISRFFGEVQEGRLVALVNSFGLLEIAVNRGSAAEFLDVGSGDRVGVLWKQTP
jgi:S-adenosyl-L-methionine hydrolase (adenosine-forming)